MRKVLPIAFSIALLGFFTLTNADAAVKAGTSCPKSGKTSTADGRIYTCIKLGSKLYWNNGTIQKPSSGTKQATPAAQGTVSQQNAVKLAATYLKYSAYSRTGLISQLEYEGFSNSDATYGVDFLNADWNQQAALMAASYLKYSAYSRSSLVDQLVYEGFSQSQAEYGVSRTGL
jgi:hypothetical protein